MTALQDNDLLVEVNGVPHRVSRDEGGLVRSHAPGVVVAIRVSEGDEVQAGDVVAVTESMKMESSLVAPVSGRVREVLVSANVQVPGGRPLVQIDPQDDSPAAVEGKRVTFDAGDPEPGGGPSGLERLRRLALGYDVTPAEAKRVVGEVMASPADLEREGRLLEVYADVRALNRPHAERERRRRGAVEPAGAPARVPALARRRGRGPARPLRRAARARARPPRRDRPRAHRRARGRRLPPVPGPAARGHRARRRARAARAPPRAGRAARGGGRRRVPRRARPPRGRARPARARARRAGARAALAHAATARPSRPRARRPTPRRARISPRSPSSPTPATARRTCRRWWTARSRSRGC